MLLFPSERLVINDCVFLHELYSGRCPYDLEEFLLQPTNNRIRRTGASNPDLYNHHESHSLIRRNGSFYSSLGPEIQSLPKKLFKKKVEELFLNNRLTSEGRKRHLINTNNYRKRVFSKRKLFSAKSRIKKKNRA